MNKIIVLLALMLAFDGLAQKKKQPAKTTAPATAALSAGGASGAYASATEASEGKVKWLSIEQAYKANQKEPRKWMIDLYTDWCGWCKVMDRETFSNPQVAQVFSKKYYAIKYNPEKEADFMLGNQSFRAMLQNKVTGYPTTVYLDENLNMIQPIGGFMKVADYMPIITFFGYDHYKSDPWEKFQKEIFPQKYATVSQ
jgi:thioredoxin-related protein